MRERNARRKLSPFEASVGNLVKTTRWARQASQGFVADAAGFSRPNMSSIENGHHPATLMFLDNFAKALGGHVRISFVFNQDHPPMTDKQKAEAGGKDTASDLGP